MGAALNTLMTLWQNLFPAELYSQSHNTYTINFVINDLLNLPYLKVCYSCRVRPAAAVAAVDSCTSGWTMKLRAVTEVGWADTDCRDSGHTAADNARVMSDRHFIATHTTAVRSSHL